MSVITSIRESMARWIAPEARGMPQQVADALTVRSSAGVPVTESTALSASAVFAAVRVIAETIAQIHWEIYQRTGEAEIELDDHPLRILLDEEPNGGTALHARSKPQHRIHYLWPDKTTSYQCGNIRFRGQCHFHGRLLFAATLAQSADVERRAQSD